MQKERRTYPRVYSEVHANFYVESDSGNPKEFSGIIENISENGIKILISGSEYLQVVNEIDVGDQVSFQALDEYKLYEKTYMDIFKGQASVVRIEKDEDRIILGCKINLASEDFERYINNKRISLFLNTIKREH